MKALIHQKETLFQVSLKNIKTTQVLSWLKLKTNPKLLDLGKLILMRSKSLSKIRSQKSFPKIWYEHKNSFKNAAFFAKYICDDINTLIRSSKFHNELKEADIVPVHKKKSKFSKENYRPISNPPNISKVYERCLYNQESIFFEDIFSKYQCGFRKGYRVQHCLLVMREKWKKIVAYGGLFGALLTDSSKAFDCIPLDLLIAKL